MQIIGCLYLMRWIYLFIDGISNIIIVYFLGVKFYLFGKDVKIKEKFGEWAVITGATDGIGLGYAKELAKQGVNLIIISRSEEKLNKTEKELTSTYNIKVKTYQMNLVEIEKYEKQLEELHNYSIGVLINNVGTSYEFPDYTHLLSPDFVHNICVLNLKPMIYLTNLLLGDMVKREKGCIVNIGSGAACICSGDPLYSYYAATKSYNLLLLLIIIFIF